VNNAAAAWPYRLSGKSPKDIDTIRAEVDRLGARAQYGWGHSIDFGAFRKDGLLGEAYLAIAGAFDALEWWPRDLAGLRVADVGCFTGGLSLLMASRGAAEVYAVDEIPEHLDQAAFLAKVFGAESVTPVRETVYRLERRIPAATLDLVVLSGVLYHLSDMLVGLYALRRLLKPDGVLLIESNAVEDEKASYANFGRFFAGMWWQPSTLCIRDLCTFMGFRDPVTEMYRADRCLARAVAGGEEPAFRRGLNWEFPDLRDATVRTLDPSVMAPARRE
jgi:SAM-dependent methyltransferase